MHSASIDTSDVKHHNFSTFLLHISLHPLPTSQSHLYSTCPPPSPPNPPSASSSPLTISSTTNPFSTAMASSIRNPSNLDTFYMSHNVAPALVSSIDDQIEFRVEHGTPVNLDPKTRWSERYIHSEIYKRFSGIHCVVYRHCSDVLPYCISGVQLRPGIHMAGFLDPSSTPLHSSPLSH